MLGQNKKNGRSKSKDRGLEKKDRAKYVLRSLLTAMKGLQHVKKKLPKVDVSFTSPEGPVDKRTQQEIYQDAKKENIAPYNTVAR